MEPLKVWVGHMSDDPTAWFVVSAPSRDEALWVADQLGSIDTRSLYEVKSSFAIHIGSHVVEDMDEESLALGSEDMHDADEIYWTDVDAETWATEIWKNPSGGDDLGMIESAAESAAAQHPIDVTQSEPKIHRPRRDEDTDE